MLSSNLLPKRGEFMIKPVKGDHAELAEPEVHAIEGVVN
jgi:hypothetical protein